MHSVRVERVRELLRRQLGEIIRRELTPEASALASVNSVHLTPDLKNATVFVGVIGSPDVQQRTIDHLNAQRGRIQHLVAEAVVLRHTPRLRFQLDLAIERGNRVLSILDELERSNPGTGS
jgi:ribosome-binding factor A